jgi:DNA invertase Pin-like site-specific DNA recombinase
MKCLVMIRVSTDRQQLDDQHREMVEFCKNEGYTELVFVEDKGASAIKLNDSYQAMISQVKESITNDPDIKCMAVWELSRAFRNEGVYYEIKTFLVSRGVQFICKNPYLKLLNPDGTVNQGMEVATGMLAILAKQEMELKKERFKRAKQAKRNQGMYVGGSYIKFGYRLDRGYLEIDPIDAPKVREIFELYSTGRYSVRSLSNELIERGIVKKDGQPINANTLNHLIADDCYVGRDTDIRYPAIISRELYDKVKEIREGHTLSMPKGRKYCFGSGILKCPLCGCNMIAEGVQYRCWHHNRLSNPPHCDNGLVTRVENLDGLLWWITEKEHTKYLMKSTLDKTTEYTEKIDTLQKKIDTLQKKIDDFDRKKEKIIDLYVSSVITKEELEKRTNKGLLEVKTYKDTILSYNEKIEGFKRVLEGDTEGEITLERLTSLYSSVLSVENLKTMQELVKKHISKVVCTPLFFGKDRNTHTTKPNAQLITVELSNGDIQRYAYVPRKYKNCKYWYYFDNDREVPILTVQPIVREKIEDFDPRMFKKIREW